MSEFPALHKSKFRKIKLMTIIPEGKGHVMITIIPPKNNDDICHLSPYKKLEPITSGPDKLDAKITAQVKLILNNDEEAEK